MSEIRAAAERNERLRQVNEGCSVPRVYGKIPKLDDWNDPYVVDVRSALGEYLRLTDETKIDREWLHSIGFADRENQLGPRYDPACRIKTDQGPLVVWNFNGECWLMEEMDRFPLKTRGQLRMLCQALGLTLTE